MSASAKLTPAARTSTTAPSGSGTSRSSSRSGPPVSARTTAFTGDTAPKKRSTADPSRLALLEEGGDALLAVVARQAADERSELTLVVGRGASLAEEALDRPDCVGRE